MGLLKVWDPISQQYVPVLGSQGPIGPTGPTPPLSDQLPLDVEWSQSAGVSTEAARADHVHSGHNYIDRNGDQMGGHLELLAGNPTLDQHATRKRYVDDQDAAKEAGLLGLLKAMGNWDTTYSNVQHYLASGGTNVDTVPAFSHTWTNPTNQRVVIRAEAFGYLYQIPDSGTTYAQVYPSNQSADVVQIDNFIFRWEAPPGKVGGFYYNSFYAFTYIEVAPGASATLRLYARTTQGSNDSYVQYCKIGATIVGYV